MVRAAPALGRRDAVTASLPAGDLAEHDLGRLVMLGSGGEGDVFALPDHPGYVYKRYLTSETPNGAALSALMTLRARMAPADRSLVDDTCAWPLARVMDGRQLVGFVMPAADRRFSHTVRTGPAAGRTILAELQHIVFRDRSQNLDLDVPRDRVVLLQLCLRWAEVIDVLHRHDVVVGDVSPRNLLWSVAGGPSVFFLDCDGFRCRGTASVLRPKQTPDWNDPALGAGQSPTIESDRYKLALVVIRCLAADPRRRPERPAPSDLEPALADLVARAAGSPDERPTAAEWVDALRRLVGGGASAAAASGPASPPRQAQATRRLAGRAPVTKRPVIDLSDAPARRSAPAGLPPTIAPPERPILDLTSPHTEKDQK